MKAMDIYDKISNPLDDDVFFKIIKDFSKSSTQNEIYKKFKFAVKDKERMNSVNY